MLFCSKDWVTYHKSLSGHLAVKRGPFVPYNELKCVRWYWGNVDSLHYFLLIGNTDLNLASVSKKVCSHCSETSPEHGPELVSISNTCNSATHITPMSFGLQHSRVCTHHQKFVLVDSLVAVRIKHVEGNAESSLWL